MSDMPESLQAGRYLCAKQWPYLADALWAIQPVTTKELKTFAVDKYWRMYFDPDLQWTAQEIATVLYHEVSHLLRRHPERAELFAELDTNAWNNCADAEINDDILQENNIKFPFDVVKPSDLKQKDGLLAEEYYANLPKKHIKLAHDCGSCAGGTKRPYEQDGPSAGQPGISKAEGELLRRHVANQIKSRGDAPAQWQRWAEEILNPQVPWQRELKTVIKHSINDVIGKTDYTFKRPSRRNLPAIILPTMQAPVPNVACVIDTSGSVGEQALGHALAELKGILRQCGQRGSKVYAVDAAVAASKKVFDVSQVVLAGGGGTDMRVGIDAALSGPKYDRPHIVVVLTDGYTPWPDAQPNAKIIIVLIQTNLDASSCPGWAKVIKVV
jgi:predicted metal-dependent peptidase